MKCWLAILCPLMACAQTQPSAAKMQDVSQAAIQSAFQILRSEYIRSSELTFDELNRAALQGLLQRLDVGAELVSKAEIQPPKTPGGVLREMLTPEIACLRPLAFTEKEIPLLETRLRELREAKTDHLILDLRQAAAPGEFAVAAAMLECFVPEHEVMFKLKQVGRDDTQLFISHRSPLWTSSLLVLIDQETNNLGETIAAVLQQRRQALLIGAPTRGTSVRYQLQPLDERWLLRFAQAEMLLADDRSLFQQGLQPDFAVSLSVPEKRALFDATDTRPSMKSTVFDQARPRYNEAALVAGKNPELDDYIRRSTGQPVADSLPPLRDAVLQRAVDMLLARRHLEGSGLDWKAGPRDARPTIKKAQRAP